MTHARPGAALVVAAAAALAALALAHAGATRAGPRLAVAAVAAAAAVCAARVRWSRVPPAVPRLAASALYATLAALGLAIVLSRQLPMVSQEASRRASLGLGGLLACGVLGFLAGGPAFGVGRHVLPAVAGLLAAAGMDPGASDFRKLACVAAAGAWTHAFLAGGPRRSGSAVALFAGASAALAAGIAWFLPFAQPHVVEYVARAYSEGRTGLSDRTQLGEVASLAVSRRVVARVFTDTPQLLRMQVFNQFDGRQWASLRRTTRTLRPLDSSRPFPEVLGRVPGHRFAAEDASGRLVETRVLPALEIDDGWGLLTPARPALVVWPGEQMVQDDLGVVSGDPRSTGLYGVANDPAPSVAPANPDDLALPPRLDPRVLQLAAWLAEGTRSDREAVERTLRHLETSYRYTLDVGAFRTLDPVAEFLFEKKAGYCEYFGTAAALLLRAQGIPTRYVKGVAVRPERRVSGHYVVRESDAHAWVEAFLEGEGWVEIDPTPSGGWRATHPDAPPGGLAERWEAFVAAWGVAWARLQQGGWPALADGLRASGEAVRRHALPLAAAAAALALALLVRARRTRAGSVTTRATGHALPRALLAVLRQVEAHWARRGRPRPVSRGLLEHLDALPAGLLGRDGEAVCRRVVLSYYGAAFGGRTPSDDELADLDRDVRALR